MNDAVVVFVCHSKLLDWLCSQLVKVTIASGQRPVTTALGYMYTDVQSLQELIKIALNSM